MCSVDKKIPVRHLVFYQIVTSTLCTGLQSAVAFVGHVPAVPSGFAIVLVFAMYQDICLPNRFDVFPYIYMNFTLVQSKASSNRIPAEV